MILWANLKYVCVHVELWHYFVWWGFYLSGPNFSMDENSIPLTFYSYNFLPTHVLHAAAWWWKTLVPLHNWHIATHFFLKPLNAATSVPLIHLLYQGFTVMSMSHHTCTGLEGYGGALFHTLLVCNRHRLHYLSFSASTVGGGKNDPCACSVCSWTRELNGLLEK